MLNVKEHLHRKRTKSDYRNDNDNNKQDCNKYSVYKQEPNYEMNCVTSNIEKKETRIT